MSVFLDAHTDVNMRMSTRCKKAQWVTGCIMRGHWNWDLFSQKILLMSDIIKITWVHIMLFCLCLYFLNNTNKLESHLQSFFSQTIWQLLVVVLLELTMALSKYTHWECWFSENPLFNNWAFVPPKNLIIQIFLLLMKENILPVHSIYRILFIY